MKFKFTIDIDEYDDIIDLQDTIVEKASEIFISQVLRYSEGNNLYTELEKRVVEKLEDIMNVDFKNEVAKRVTENLSKKYERTKQYKLIKANEEVIADNIIKSGLKDIVADIVRSEMKKVFK